MIEINEQPWLKNCADAGVDETDLRSILLAKDYVPGPTPPRRCWKSSWLPGHFDNYTLWISDLIQTPDAPAETEQTEVTRQHYDRLSNLGIGPTGKIVTEMVGPIHEHSKKLGLPTLRPGSAYSDWEEPQYAKYLRGIAERTGRKPSKDSINQAFRDKLGPNFSAIQRFRPLHELTDLIGYPHTIDWDQDDFLHWGTRVREANCGREVGQYVVMALSERDRGPTLKRVKSTFGGITGFQSEATSAWEAHLEQKDAHARELDATFADIEPRLTRPETFTSIEQKRVVAARYLVARECLPKKSETRPELLAQILTARMISSLKDSFFVTRADVELAAVQTGCFDDLWPDNSWKKPLIVTPTEVKRRREDSMRRAKLKRMRRSGSTERQS